METNTSNENSEMKKKQEFDINTHSDNNQDNNEYKEKLLDILNERTFQLVQAEKMASLGGLVAGVAHEINNPLGVSITATSHLEIKTREFVKLYRENNLKKTDLDTFLNALTETLGIISLNLQRASLLVDNFKQVAVDRRIDDERIIRFKEYIDGIILSLKPQLKRTKHTVEIKCDPALEIKTFPGSLSQIIVNFIQNSLVHGFENMESGQIIIEAGIEENFFVLKYSDNGKGIQEETLPKIYDPFFTTRRNKGGTGLGLNIVYNIVTQKFHGTINCTSKINEGTFFTIRMPLVH